MTTAWPTRPLEEVVADIRPGFASGDDLGEGIFQLRMNNLSRSGDLRLDKRRRVSPEHKQVAKSLLKPGDVLFNATNSPDLVGKTAYFPGCDEPAVFSNHFLRLRTSTDRMDPRFLTRWLQLQFQRDYFKTHCKQWVNQATFGKDRLVKLEVPLPPIGEQRRIAAVLDAADALRTKRRQALAKFDTLTQAIFIDMFGDPVENGSQWETAPLSDLLDRIDSGKSPVCLDRPARAGEWGVLKAGAVTYSVFDASQSKALPPNIAPDPRHEVRSGDLLFARKNTHDLVAACAYVWKTPDRLLLSDLIFRLVITDRSRLDPIFLQAQLVQPRLRKNIQRLAGGSSGSMPNISKSRLVGVPVCVPPAHLQKEFADRVEAANHAERSMFAGIDKLDMVFNSLQQRAFRGEL